MRGPRVRELRFDSLKAGTGAYKFAHSQDGETCHIHETPVACSCNPYRSRAKGSVIRENAAANPKPIQRLPPQVGGRTVCSRRHVNLLLFIQAELIVFRIVSAVPPAAGKTPSRR